MEKQFLILCYFLGLIFTAVSTGTLTAVPQYGFLIIGCGLILYAIVMGLVRHSKNIS